MTLIPRGHPRAPTTARATAPGARARPGVGADGQPTTSQRLFGDISPKMVELTDHVLFGDIWERPELSKRDRSLVTVSARIAHGAGVAKEFFEAR